ncbi:hypothetical protein GCM10010170_092690 [Dactylosporangium salmoneum]|uniref:Uncharacterized protein n=1 Tax=Dactylosporangium salmoneum TaxID=53361 RepID=A0ABP5UM00_9ACTN
MYGTAIARATSDVSQERTLAGTAGWATNGFSTTWLAWHSVRAFQAAGYRPVGAEVLPLPLR